VVPDRSPAPRSRSHFDALLLGYYSDDGRLHYAGRAGTGFNEQELARLAGVFKPLETPRIPSRAAAAREPVRLTP